jgi:twitching motility protein PilT
VNRIVDVFPEHQQAQVRLVLSMVLEAVICQTLLPRAGGSGRVLAYEILTSTPAVRNLIRTDKIFQLYSAMQTGREKTGMVTMNIRLAELVNTGEITPEVAIYASPDRDELEKLIQETYEIPI